MTRLEKIAMAIDYIETNLTKKIDLDMVANAVHYSKYHLHRMFSETLGMTFHDYLQRRQLTEAAKLLVFSNKSILEIALLSGYESQQAFHNIFKAMYKVGFTEKVAFKFNELILAFSCLQEKVTRMLRGQY